MDPRIRHPSSAEAAVAWSPRRTLSNRFWSSSGEISLKPPGKSSFNLQQIISFPGVSFLGVGIIPKQYICPAHLGDDA